MEKKIKHKLPRKLIPYTIDIKSRVFEIMRERSLRSETQAIEYAIVEIHRKLNSAYVRAMAPVAPEEKLRRQDEMEKAKANQKRDRLKNVCETVMGGRLDEDENGHFTCDVTQYQYVTPNKIMKGYLTVDEHEIETFPKLQYLRFPEGLSVEEREALKAKASEV